jgi:hypothetical protein
MSLRSETPNLPRPERRECDRGDEQRRSAARWRAPRRHSSISSSSSSACAEKNEPQQQHRDQQAEDDHVLERAAPERGEALDDADGERAERL